jgi:putative ABC transport system permease protein
MHDFNAHVESQLYRLAPDASLVAELAQDLEQRYEALLQDGLTAANAWREANEQMNWPRLSLELSKSLRRADPEPGNAGVLSQFTQDVRYAFRQLVRSPGFAATAVLILALAIGANTAIFSAFDALVLHPLPYRDPEQLVTITEKVKKYNLSGLPVAPVELDDLRSMTGSFSHLAGFIPGEFTLTGRGDAVAVPGLRVSASIFTMLNVKPILGIPFGTGDEVYGQHRVVVISEGLWQRRFGADPNIIGTTIEINRENYRIAAVVPPILNYLGTARDLWVPLSFQPPERAPGSRGGKSVDVVGRMRPGVTLAQATQELEAVTSRLAVLHPDGYPKDLGFSIQATHLASTVAGNLRQPLLFLLAAVSTLMLIACLNLSNLLIARASERKKEISIRTALGAGRGRIVSQLMTESLMIAAASGSLGLAMTIGFLKLFELYGSGYPNLARILSAGVNGWVVAFAIGVSSLASIIFGLIPALTTHIAPNDVLKESARGSTSGRQRLREALVALEVAASLVLLIGAGLLIRSFVRVQQVNPGFDAGNVLTFELILPAAHYEEPERRVAFYQTLRLRLEGIPGVTVAGGANRIPFGGLQGGSPLRIVGRPPQPAGSEPYLRPSRVLPGYFESLGIPLIRGRYFTAADTKDTPPVAIIDEATMLKFFPNGEDPLGRQVTGVEPDLTATIVGVVGSVKRADLSAVPEMSVYHSATQKATTSMTFTVKTATDPTAMIPAIRHALAGADPLIPMARTATMEQRLSDSLARQRVSMHLMTFFGVAALLLAATGLYGVLSYVVNQRRREVGIRVALGAAPLRVVELIAVQGLFPVAAGIATGLAAAAASARLLETVLFEMSPNDPLVYASVTGLLVLLAIAAIAVPVRRAVRVDPVMVLREE